MMYIESHTAGLGTRLPIADLHPFRSQGLDIEAFDYTIFSVKRLQTWSLPVMLLAWPCIGFSFEGARVSRLQ